MPFYVAVHHRVHPGCMQDRVEAVRRDFAASPLSYPGRRFARLFEHVDDETRLFAMEEWLDQAEFERHERDLEFVGALERSGPPPHIDVVERLQHYRHLPHAPIALACTTISSAPGRVDEVEAYICDEERREVLVSSGLVIRAVYRVVASPDHLLVLHGWRSMDDLHHHLGGSAVTMAETLASRGATIDQFAGRIAAEYSWLES